MIRSALSALLLIIIPVFTSCGADTIQTGAEQTAQYIPLLKGKKVAVIANPSSVINHTHLVDTLLSLKINIKAVFAPEHGFRGQAEAGEHINNGKDPLTNLKVISLYGEHKKPTNDDLKDVDLMLFDIQDAGVRFYTYISTLQYVMEAAAEKNISVVVLDRPNPHGFYIDGPVLDSAYQSFVGMNPVPVVYGMTIGEYAMMLNGEGWLAGKKKCNLTVVKLKGWDHRMTYELPVAPSPNLPNQAAVMLYPSLCFFEGTKVSVGRGTEYPFQVIGYPGNPEGDFEFTPVSMPGKSLHPPYENIKCRGFKLTDFGNDVARNAGRLFINWLIQAYNTCDDSSKFFIPFFEKLAGTGELRKQIEAGWSEEQIRNSWGPGLLKFQAIRKKYLLYQDFI